MSASEAAGIDKEQVEVHVTFARGSFGLHSSSKRDPTAEAVQIARALDWKHPIKVQSLLEEDFKSGRSARWPYTAYGPRRTQTVD